MHKSRASERASEHVLYILMISKLESPNLTNSCTKHPQCKCAGILQSIRVSLLYLYKRAKYFFSITLIHVSNSERLLGLAHMYIPQNHLQHKIDANLSTANYYMNLYCLGLINGMPTSQWKFQLVQGY